MGFWIYRLVVGEGSVWGDLGRTCFFVLVVLFFYSFSRGLLGCLDVFVYFGF